MIKNLPITTKSLLAPLFACCMMLVIVAVFYNSFKTSKSRYAESGEATAMYEVTEGLQQQINRSQNLLSRNAVRVQTETGVSLDEAGSFVVHADDYIAEINASRVSLNTDLGRRNNDLMQQLDVSMAAYEASFRKIVAVLDDSPYEAVTVLSESYEVFDRLSESVQEVEEFYERMENELHSQSLHSQEHALVQVIGVSVVALLASLIAAVVCGHAISSPIRNLAHVVSNLADGNYKVDVSHTDQRDEIGTMASSIEHLKQKLQAADILARGSQMAAYNSRIRQALDSANTSLVVTDNDGQAIFVNEGMKGLLNRVEAVLPKGVRDALGDSEVPLNLAQLQFSDHQCKLDNLMSKDVREFELDGLMLRQMITPVLDADGARDGLVLEWTDLSDQLEREAQIQAASARELEQAEDLKNGAQQLLRLVDAALEGDLTQRVSIDGNSAISQIGLALDGLFDNLSGSISAISCNAAQLNTSAGEISELNQSMNDSAAAASKQIDHVSGASAEVSDHVSQISTLVSDMTDSFTEVFSHAEDASAVAGRAVNIAQSTDALVRQLSESSSGIGAVIKVITSIAEQTNLLALNATIEAARAGESGKGFAVVANEVKELAKETAKATDEISQRINAIQRDSDGAVTAIGEISEIIVQINQLQDSISTGVSKQKHAVEHISRFTDEADVSTTGIVSNLSQVSGSATETLDGTVKALAAARTLKSMSASMHDLASRFRIREPRDNRIDKAA